MNDSGGPELRRGWRWADRWCDGDRQFATDVSALASGFEVFTTTALIPNYAPRHNVKLEIILEIRGITHIIPSLARRWPG